MDEMRRKLVQSFENLIRSEVEYEASIRRLDSVLDWLADLDIDPETKLALESQLLSNIEQGYVDIYEGKQIVNIAKKTIER